MCALEDDATPQTEGIALHAYITEDRRSYGELESHEQGGGEQASYQTD